MSALSYVNGFRLLFIWFLVTVCIPSSHGNKVLLDISDIYSDPKQTENVLASGVRWFHENNAHTEMVNPVLLYFETDFMDNTYENTEKLLRDLTKSEFNTKLFLNIKLSLGDLNDMKNYVDTVHSNLLKLLNQHNSIIAGLSYQLINLKGDCRQAPSVTRDSKMKNTTLIQEVKHFLLRLNNDNPANLVDIGYTVDHDDSFHCDRHIQYKRQADYLIINIALRRNDKIFVESYGAFKENMEKKISTAMQNVENWNKSKRALYLRIVVTANFDLGYVRNHRCAGSNVPEAHQSILNTAVDTLKTEENKLTRRYDTLLTLFCHQWAAEEKGTKGIIIKYKQGPPTTKDEHTFSNMSLVIPQITNLPGKTPDEKLIMSISILLEDVASSGFDTVVINGDTWQTLVRDEFPKPNGIMSPLRRPKNVWYLNNMNNMFSMSSQPELEKLLAVDEMRLVVFELSSNYEDDESKSFSWKNVVGRLKVKGRGTSSPPIRTACAKWPDSFGPILKRGTYDAACAALELQKLPSCHSLESSSELVVWRGVLTFKTFELDNFVEETMKKLDTLVIARQMIKISYPDKQVVLRIKVDYLGEGNIMIRYPIYCTKLGENVSRIYETLLTWAQIHDFPIILEPISDGKGYNNPIAWQQQRTLAPGRMHKLMESFPIFIRRRYNQSIVFGSWTRGAYPCIQQSQQSSLKDVNFNHNFAGATLRMDLRKDGIPLTSEELHILMLFALKKFIAVDIVVLTTHQMATLLEIVSRSDFAAILESNQIEAREIYVGISPQIIANDKDVITRLVSKLQNHGFKVHLHFVMSVKNTGIFDLVHANHLGGIFFGLIHDDCTDVARFSIQNKLNNISQFQYLICDTNFVLANNQGKEVMQDYLESHLYLKKLLQYFYPNLKEIHFRLHTTLVTGSPYEKSLNQLLFLADMNKFSQSHGIQYFLVQIISPESQSETESSFWTVRNYTNLADVSVFEERQAVILNQTTWTPTREIIVMGSMLSKGALYAIIAAVLLIVVIVTALSVKYRCICLKCQNKTLPKTIKNPESISVSKNEYLETSHFDSREVNTVDTLQEEGINLQEIESLRQSLNYNEIAKESIKVNFDQILGSGQFGVVYRAVLHDFAKEVAVKVVHDNSPKESLKDMWSEIELLNRIGDHCNVIRFIGCYIAEMQSGVVWIVMELCSHGSLLSLLRKFDTELSTEQLPVKDLMKYALGIATGMEYIAEKDIIHGDLSARNVLLDENNICKIGDFGLSRKVYQYQLYVKTSQEPLPWRWMAYESLKRLEFTKQSDIWSYGVTLWEIFTLGDVPYPGLSWSVDFVNVLKSGLRLPIPCHAKLETYDIMQKCWRVVPKNRPTFSELVNYFTEQLNAT